MKALYKVSISAVLGYDCIADCSLNLQKGDKVIVRCERYQDIATVESRCPIEPFKDVATYEREHRKAAKGRNIEGQKTPLVLRVASEEDIQKTLTNEEKAREVHNKALERIKFHKLDMKLIHTHYSFDRKVLVFQFSADGRVDFRELLKDLSGLFHVRVELRQVGVRDETAILGGIGICGRRFCCSSFLSSFSSINVKMAKEQGLSLNPQNIAGCCGRLKCCLDYEAGLYKKSSKPRKQQNEEADEIR